MADREIKSYDELYTLFTSKFFALTNFVTDSNIGSVVRAFGQAVTFFANFIQVQIQVAFDSFRVKTAKGENLDNRIADFNMERVDESFAQGYIVFMRNTAAEEDFIIPEGTIVSTEEDVFGQTLDYSLVSDVEFASGTLSATGTVVCLTAGRDGNVASGAITNIKNVIDGVDSITNPEAFQNGAFEESDDQVKARVPLHINGLQGANESSIRNAALSVQGVTFAKVADNTPSVGEFTVYFSNYSGIVDTTLLESVRDAVEAVTAFCVVANFATPNIINTTIEFDLELDGDYLLGLGAGATASGTVIDAVKDAVYDFVQLNTESVLRVSDIIVIAKDIPGVRDVSSVEINGVAANYEVDDFEVIKLESVNSITTNTTIV